MSLRCRALAVWTIAAGALLGARNEAFAGFVHVGTRSCSCSTCSGGAPLLIPKGGQGEAPTPELHTVTLPGSDIPYGEFREAGTVTTTLGSFGININPGAGLAANPDALAAFQRAANQWIDRIADPITINIDANFRNLGSSQVIGQTLSVMLGSNYQTVRDLMVADAAGEADDGIVGSLPNAGQFSALLPLGFGLTGNVAASKANAKALLNSNDLDLSFGLSDGLIEFNNQFVFDFDSSDGLAPGTVDFETVAAHEIGHLLGFLSSVDTVDFLLAISAPGSFDMNPLDLFRFQNDVAGRDPGTLAEFTNFARLLAPGGQAITDEVFAPVAILRDESRMSTGSFFGDGRQASHWLDNDLAGGDLIGIMDPTLASQTIVPISEADYRALDLIGYDIVAVPEPGAFVLIGIGMTLAWGYRARRRMRMRLA